MGDAIQGAGTSTLRTWAYQPPIETVELAAYNAAKAVDLPL